MLLNNISVFSSGGHFVQWSMDICVILVEGLRVSLSQFFRVPIYVMAEK